MKITITDGEDTSTWEAEGALLIVKRLGKFEAIMKGQVPSLAMHLVMALLGLLKK